MLIIQIATAAFLGDIIDYMNKESVSGHEPNLLQKATEDKKQLINSAAGGITSSMMVSRSEAALGFGVPSDVLKSSAVTLTPRGEQVEVTFGRDPEQHLNNLVGWWKEERREKQSLLKESFDFLFLAGQASVNPSVDFERIMEAISPKMRILEAVVPEIEEIRLHLEQGGEIQDLTREDKAHWRGIARSVFNTLSPSLREDLKRQGRHPDNMFQTPDE